jgi:hypothetical protein
MRLAARSSYHNLLFGGDGTTIATAHAAALGQRVEQPHDEDEASDATKDDAYDGAGRGTVDAIVGGNDAGYDLTRRKTVKLRCRRMFEFVYRWHFRTRRRRGFCRTVPIVDVGNGVLIVLGGEGALFASPRETPSRRKAWSEAPGASCGDVSKHTQDGNNDGKKKPWRLNTMYYSKTIMARRRMMRMGEKSVGSRLVATVKGLP